MADILTIAGKSPEQRTFLQKATRAVRMGTETYLSSGNGRQALFAAYQEFMSPLAPLVPTVTGGEPRRFDWQQGYNINYVPRALEGISFEQLRALGDAHYLTRLAIETRKDQISKLDWKFSLKPRPGEPSRKVRERSDSDPRVKKIQEFFARPDGENDLSTWLRLWVEDMLVIDAASLLIGRENPDDLGSRITRLVPIDGATISRKISPDGTTPVHPMPAYQQIIKGQILCDLTTKQLVYMMRNPRTNRVYGMSPVEQIILIVNMALRRDMSKLAYYTLGSIPDAIAQVPETWGPDQIDQFQKAWDAALSGNVGARRMLRFIPSLGSGGKQGGIVQLKEAMLKDEWDEFIARVICFCFSLPPTAFVKQNNRATAQTAQKQALQEGFEPTKNWIEDKVNWLIQSPDILNEPEVIIAAEDEDDIDPQIQANVDKINVSMGIESIDEIRERDGKEPWNIGPFVLTAQGPVMLDDVKSGEGRVLPNKGSDPTQQFSTDGKFGTPKKPALKPAVPAAAAKADLKKKVLSMPLAKLPAHVETKVRKAAGTIERFFRKEAKKLAREVAEGYSEVAKASDEDAAERIVQDVSFDTWTALVPSIASDLEQIAQETAREVLITLGVDDSEVFDQVNQDALEFARARAAELVGRRIVGGELVDNPNAEWAITETTREELKQLVIEAFAEGLSPAALETKIENAATFSAARAEMIARTELSRAHIQGALSAAAASGVVTAKYSLLGSEHDMDDECDTNADAGELKLDEPFPSGDIAPPFHPNCVCAMEFTYQGE
ncbi:MAG TPA: phage portal protein [Candidatus Acidoferrales bacterium]|nr:phage portal protein [Candidatus Acidoferrales bacterium]